MNVEQAAKLLGVSGARVRQMLLTGKLVGTKFNQDWVITVAAVKERLKVGRDLRRKFGPKTPLAVCQTRRKTRRKVRRKGA